MTTATETFTKIQNAAQKTVPSLRIIDEMKTGDVIRQGDIYIERLARLPEKRGAKTTVTQLAIGQTQGSRHIIDPKPIGLVIYAPRPGATPLEGPIVSSKRNRFRLTHPEHGHFDLPAGVYQVTYQRDFARERAEEIRRVAD